MKNETKPTCILVLGKRLQPDGTAHEMLRRRVAAAAKLYTELFENGVECFILCSGGMAEKGLKSMAGKMPCEAVVMKDLLTGTHGVPSLAVIMESKSLTTVQNMECCRPIIADRYAKVYLITSEFHMDRSMVVFVNVVVAYADRVEAYPHDSGISELELAKERSIEREMIDRYKTRFPNWKFT
jgi:uncharacterized SAM-binding protein YcdF (DUF218 family)